MARALCHDCLRSVEAAELSRLGERRLCASCLALARRRAEAPARPPAPAGFLRGLRAEILEGCRGRWWLARLPFLPWFGWILWQHLSHPPYSGMKTYTSLWWGLNTGIHELGHYVFRPFGSFVCYLGGSLSQCLAPVLAMWVFRRQRDYFAIAVAFGWLSDNLFDVSWYVADARAMRLGGIAPGIGLIPPGSRMLVHGHDWYNILRTLCLLHRDQAIAEGIRCAAVLSMAVCLGGGGWLLWRMARPPATR